MNLDSWFNAQVKNSTQLVSYSQLQECANALNNGLSDVVVAGHTDSDGGEDYNLALSQRRAQAVKDFLVSAYSVAESHLRVDSSAGGQ